MRIEEGLFNIWWNTQMFNHIGGGHRSVMTLQLRHCEFTYIWWMTVWFSFYQCGLAPSPAPHPHLQSVEGWGSVVINRRRLKNSQASWYGEI
jgi:hypothetical protein